MVIKVASFVLCIFAAGAVVAKEASSLKLTKPTQPSYLVHTQPVSLLVKNINLGIQIPLSPNWTIGPKATLFLNGLCKLASCQGSEVGIRGQYFLNGDWNGAGPVLKTGLYLSNWATRGSGGGGHGVGFGGGPSMASYGVMAEGLYGYQWWIFQKAVAIDIGAGLEALPVQDRYLFSDGYDVLLTFELNMAIAL